MRWNISRRDLIMFAALAGRTGVAFGESDFWNYKDPQNYSHDEKQRLLTNSPWAKRTHSEAPASNVYSLGKNIDSASPADAVSLHGTARVGGMATEVYPDRKGGEKPFAFYGQVTIRWASAEPIRAIDGIAFPDEYRNHYAISVTGLPEAILATGTGHAPLPQALLTPAGHGSLPAEFVMLTPDKKTLVFAFPAIPMDLKSKTIAFTMILGGITLKAKFEPKEMIYRGQLAL